MLVNAENSMVAGNVEALLFPVCQADKLLKEMYKGC